MWKWACLLTLLLVTACSKEELLEKISSKEEQAHAKEVIHHLRAGEFEAIETALDPSLRTKDMHEMLFQLRDMIPPGKPNSSKLVGAHISTLKGATIHQSVFEYNFGDKWILIAVDFKSKDGVETISALNVKPEAHPYDEKNAANTDKNLSVQDDILQKISPPEEQAHVKELIQQLRNGEYAAIEKVLDPSMRTEKLHQTLIDMRAMIPTGVPDSVKLIGAHSNSIDGARVQQTAFEYNFGGKWLVISVSFKRKDDVETVYGFRVVPEDHPYRE